METSYVIKKIMVDNKGKKTHVLITDAHSEVMEFDDIVEATRIVDMLNFNSDSGWTYELVEIKK